MATCISCGVFMPGASSSLVQCSTGCLKPPAPMPPPQIIGMSEHLDSRTLVTFTILAGSVAANSEWKHCERVPTDSTLIVREITAITAGGAGDVNLVLDSSSVKLVDFDHDKLLFERPLGILTVTDARNRNVETEERLSRLERMMNVLVEQESPAGEALRRLGGTKISYESPTKLARPALFSGGCTVGIHLTVHDALSLLNDVVVRVSVIGISKRPVL